MAATFIQISFSAIDKLLENPKLPGNVFRIWLYLGKLDPFGDRGRRLPTYNEIAQSLQISVDTVRRSLEVLEELGFITIDHFKTKQFVNSWKNFKVGLSKMRKKFFSPQQGCDLSGTDEIQPAPMPPNPHGRNYQQLKLLETKAFESPQTLQTFDPPQTVEGEDQKTKDSNSEESKEEEDQNKSSSSLPNDITKDKSSPAVVRQKHEIPDELAERLRMCNIPLSEEVLVKIRQHHISQSYGAITHVENTWATIKDAKSIFLYQIPRQPIEKLGQRYSDELLEKQKRENERIDREIAQGRPSLASMPKFAQLKQKLAKKLGSNKTD